MAAEFLRWTRVRMLEGESVKRRRMGNCVLRIGVTCVLTSVSGVSMSRQVHRWHFVDYGTAGVGPTVRYGTLSFFQLPIYSSGLHT